MSERAKDYFDEKVLREVLSKVRSGNRTQIAQTARCQRETVQRTLKENGERLSLSLFVSLAEAVGVKLGKPAFSHKEHSVKSEGSQLEFPLFGYVQAGPPNSPEECIKEGIDIETIKIGADSWKSLFPRVNPRGLVALRVSGESMQPFFYDGDLIFVQRTQDRSLLADGHKVIVTIPGDGMTFKVWRDNGILESINRDVFAPRICPKSAKLWGIVICGTRTA